MADRRTSPATSFRAIALGATWCALSAALPAWAEPHTDPNEFYEKNFAEAPGEQPAGGGKIEVVVPTPPSELSNAEQRNPSQTSGSSETPDDPVQRALQAARDKLAGNGKSTPQPITSKLQIISIDAIINAENEKHLSSTLNELRDFLKKSSITCGALYLIGNRRGVPLDFSAVWGSGGGKIFFMDEPPAKFAAVKHSPTWILSAEDQQVLIEGLGPITEHLTPDGKIISAVREVTPEANATANPQTE